MKKTITLLAGIIISVGLFAQVNSSQSYIKNLLKAKYDFITMSGDEALSHLLVNPNTQTSAILNSSKSNTEVVIGTTTYDLQTNASVQNRILVHDDGTISAVWTMSQAYNAAFTDRGTGYNYFDGTSWVFNFLTAPEPRLENSRGGWPSIIALGNGTEASITHNTDNNYINNAYRTAVGTGSWFNGPITDSYLIWNRSASGGLDGNTIHMIALTEPEGGTWTGTLFNGLSGALLYYRSEDGGDSWNIQDMQLPGMDTSMTLGMNGDVYSIAAQDSIVVVAYFDDWGDSYIVKSTDNGETWIKTTFLDFPVDKYAIDDGIDLDNNDSLDYVYSTDNNGALILDSNGEAHVFYGIMMYLDDDLTDLGAYTYIPSTNGIAYWNESMGEDTTPPTIHVGDTSLWYSDMMNDHWITEAPDLNGDCSVGGVDTAGGYALYSNSRASMPSAGISANGEIYLSFSGYTETADDGDQVYRHIYLIKSPDGGQTWSNPIDVTPHDGSNGGIDWDGRYECVFGSMNPEVDDKIRIIYQLDYEPGLSVRGDGTQTSGEPGYGDQIELNEIIYLEVDTAQAWDYCIYGCTDAAAGNYDPNAECDNGCCDNASPNAVSEEVSKLSIYPNPVKKILTIDGDYTSATIYDLFGKLVLTTNYQKTIDVATLSNGIYFIKTDNKMTKFIKQ